MKSLQLLASSLFAFGSLISLLPAAQAQLLDFELLGCGRFRQEAYYRTEFHYVNICLGEANLQMVVTDNDGLARERIPVEKKGDRYEGISDRGIGYSIDRRTFIIKFKGQSPSRERVEQASFGMTKTESAYRYNCQSQVKPFKSRQNVSLSEAERLVRQREGKLFIYHCMPTNQAAVVSGVVTYRQRIALPPNSVIEIKIQDVSRADAPAITLAQKTITTTGQQVPIPFSLAYNPDKIKANHSYAVQVRILINGKLRWINKSRYSVITQGNPNQVEVVVGQVQ